MSDNEKGKKKWNFIVEYPAIDLRDFFSYLIMFFRWLIRLTLKIGVGQVKVLFDLMVFSTPK